MLLAETVGGEAWWTWSVWRRRPMRIPKMVQELVELYFAQAKDLMNGLRGGHQFRFRQGR